MSESVAMVGHRKWDFHRKVWFSLPWFPFSMKHSLCGVAWTRATLMSTIHSARVLNRCGSESQQKLSGIFGITMEATPASCNSAEIKTSYLLRVDEREWGPPVDSVLWFEDQACSGGATSLKALLCPAQGIHGHRLCRNGRKHAYSYLVTREGGSSFQTPVDWDPNHGLLFASICSSSAASFAWTP